MYKSWLVIASFFLFFCSFAGLNRNLESLQISKISCELVQLPTNRAEMSVDFSWIITSSRRNGYQSAYRIEVATTAAGIAHGVPDLWNSGKVNAARSTHLKYGGKPITGLSGFYYRISMWDNAADSVQSDIRYFALTDLSLRLEHSQWIGNGPVHDQLPAKGFYSGAKEEGKSGDSVHHDGRSLLLREEFRLLKKVKKAMVALTGLGLYELYINGERVGDHLLSPAKTPYHRQILYDTFEVTSLLKEGANAIGIHLGNGWYNPYKKWWQEYRMQWFGSKKAILSMVVELEDGTTQTIQTNGSWKSAPGPVLFNCIYDGEQYDATKEIPGWNRTGFDDRNWKQAVVMEPPTGKLFSCQMAPIRAIQRLSPRKITKISPRVAIIDFGQNFAGWSSIALKGKKGMKIKVRHSEELDPSGHLDVTCNEQAVATAEYTLKGEGIEVCEPHFTYFGFQYAEISSEEALPELLKIEGVVVHSDNQPVGTFSCDNQLVNKIHHATRWSQKSNMIGYPMDCPQRDERLGWLGDAQVTAEEALFNFDMERFYRNWLAGIRLNQDPATGDIPIISPRPYLRDDGVEWSSTFLTLAWDCYRYYGNPTLLEENYPSMVRYIQFLRNHAKDLILPKGWIGDWGSRAKGWKEGDPESIPTAYFYWDVKLLAKMAGILGKQEDAHFYASMADSIQSAYNSRFFHPEIPQYHDGSQMASAFPLYLELVPKEHENQLLDLLVHQITVVDSGRLTTGVLGTKYMPEVLTRMGRPDIAWKLVNVKGYPGWEQMMTKYNTMCEFWTMKQSHNHVMMGSIDSWFYETLAGIELDEDFPAYEKTTIHPYFPKDLNRAEAVIETVRGKLSSAWERVGDQLVMKVSIPFNCRSEVWIPNKNQIELMESGVPIARKKEITLLKKVGDFDVYAIGSGQYKFEAKYLAGRF